MSNPRDFLLKEAGDLAKSKNFEDAIKNLDEIKNTYDNQDKDFWFNKGEHLVKIQEYEKAIECFDKDLELNKKSYRTFFAKGVCHYLNKLHHSAIESFNSAWEIKYAGVLKSVDQAKSLKNVKKFEKALKYFDSANVSDIINSEFWHYKGLTLFEIEKYKEATECFDKILQNDPDNPETLYNKAKCELHLGTIESCTTLLEKACRLDSSMKEILKNDALFKGIPREKLSKIV